MKKQIKIISMLLIAVVLTITLSGTVMATGVKINSALDTISKGNSNADVSKVVSLGATIVTIVQTVGIVVAVVILLVLGIKYMMGSAEEKAEYKKTMIPYMVGAILIFGATTIVRVVYQIANGINA